MLANVIFTETNMCHPARPSLSGPQKAKLQPPRQRHFVIHARHKVLPLHTSKAEAIHVMLQKYSFPADLAKKVLNAHPTYVHWDVEAELRPAVAAWLHELGLQQMATTWQAVPGLLIYPTSKLHELCTWLTSLGVQDPKKYVLSRTFLLAADLNTLQERAAAVFAWAQVPDEHVAAILHRHPFVLNGALETTKCRIELVASVLEVPINSPQVAKLLSVASRHMFGVTTSTLEQGIAYLDGFGLSTSGKAKALRYGIYGLPVPVLEARVQHLACKFGWSQETLPKRVNSMPGILTLTPNRIDVNLDSLRLLGFSSDEVTDMAARRAFLLTANWGTKLRQDKWQFLKTALQLSPSAVCATPDILEASLRNKLVPRWQFLCDLASKGALAQGGLAHVLRRNVLQSDQRFARQFNKPEVMLVYDDAYKQACWDRYISER